MRFPKWIFVSLFFLAGCDQGFRTLKATEYGLLFRRLPTFLGGGVASRLAPPGELVIVWPWDTLYTVTSSVREVSWGPGRQFEEYVNTRAKDGNEVALAISVRYQLSVKPEELIDLLQNVATNDEQVAELVISVARADIRHYMNGLRTAEFIDPDELRKALETVRTAMQEKLKKYHVEVLNVALDDFRFERALEGGKKDDTYQERLDEIQKIVQETERETSRINTVMAAKEQELNQTQGSVNKILEEARGVKDQAQIRGDNYLKSKSNEAQEILARGNAEAEGIVAQIKALSGPGGRAILKLDLASRLETNDSKFIVMNENSGVTVNKTDTNELIRQMGIIDAVQSPPTAATKRAVIPFQELTPPSSGAKNEQAK